MDWKEIGRQTLNMWGHIMIGQLVWEVLFHSEDHRGERALVMLLSGLLVSALMSWYAAWRERMANLPPSSWVVLKWDSQDGPAVLRIATNLAAAESPETDEVLWVIKNAIDAYQARQREARGRTSNAG